VAELVATNRVPELIAGFDLARFGDGRLVGEKGAAAVGH
jgi:sarcosine oxidase subunit beta